MKLIIIALIVITGSKCCSYSFQPISVGIIEKRVVGEVVGVIGIEGVLPGKSRTSLGLVPVRISIPSRC